VYLYAIHYTVIKNFRHKGLGRFFSTGSKAGIQTKHAARLRLQLGRLDAATSSEDMNLPGWKLHPLKGDLRGYWAVWVDENWRLVFTFEGTDAALVDYTDYH
jgi:proteic killer suppression protein